MPVQLKSIQLDNFVKTISKRHISKSLVALFLTFELVFGYNFGFIKAVNSHFRAAANVLRRCMALFVFVLFIFLCKKRPDSVYWYSIYWVQYLAYFIVQSTSKYYIFDYINDVQKFNEDIMEKNVGTIAIIVFSIINLIKFVICFFYCMFDGILCKPELVTSKILEIIFCLITSCVDIVPLAQIIVFYYLNNCTNKLRVMSEIALDVKKLQQLYIDIDTSFDSVFPNYSQTLIVQLIADVPRLMMMISIAIFFIQRQMNFLILSEVVYSSVTIFFIVIPALIAERINSNIDAVKKNLHKKLLIETNVEYSDRNNEIRRLLRYMEAQPLRRKIWGVVPLDLHLLVSVISLCTTYVIVIIQMSHIYN